MIFCVFYAILHIVFEVRGTRHTNTQVQQHYVSPLFGTDDPVRIFDVGYHKTPPLHCFGPAVRPYYLLHLIEKGRGYVLRNGERTELSAGDAFLIKPEEVTLYCSDEKEPWEYRWISFEGSLAKMLLEKTTDKLFMKYQKSGIIALKTAFENRINDYMGCLNTLFEVLNSIKDARRGGDETDVITAAMHYIENNYFRAIDVGTLAMQMGFSRAYFTSIFSKRTGETPYGYLTKIRIRRAKEYLETRSYSVEEIAYSVGFSSVQRFSELFKKYTGVSPLQYRKSILKV